MTRVSEINKAEFAQALNEKENLHTLFITPEWISFLEADGRGRAVYLKLEQDGVTGWFAGLLFRKLGVKIFASPFEQWFTCNMGFAAPESFDRAEGLAAAAEFMKKTRHCGYMEAIDARLGFEDIKKINCSHIVRRTYLLDIDRPDEEIMGGFKSECRTLIRQFEKRGARLEAVPPSESFANEYYDQLIDVFAKQNLKPHNSRRQVIRLMEAFRDKPENLLCVRVTEPENGKCIATSIFPGFGDTAYFWGAASWREFQHYRPNEYMIWTAIKYWRERGCKTFDMVGLRDYKKKFGPVEYAYPRVIITSSPLLIKGRNLAKKLIAGYRKLRGK